MLGCALKHRLGLHRLLKLSARLEALLTNNDSGFTGKVESPHGHAIASLQPGYCLGKLHDSGSWHVSSTPPGTLGREYCFVNFALFLQGNVSFFLDSWTGSKKEAIFPWESILAFTFCRVHPGPGLRCLVWALWMSVQPRQDQSIL